MNAAKLLEGRKKATEQVRFEPYDDHEGLIFVPFNRRKMTSEQKKAANQKWKDIRACQICGHAFTDKNHSHIDHCHVTGVIRGKICRRCNLALGLFRDDLYTVRQAVDYLDHFRYNPDLVEPDIWDESFKE